MYMYVGTCKWAQFLTFGLVMYMLMYMHCLSQFATFGLVFFFMYMGFAHAFLVIFDNHHSLDDVLSTLMFTFRMTVGDFDYDQFRDHVCTALRVCMYVYTPRAVQSCVHNPVIYMTM